MSALAETFGPNCEVVLHDLSHPQRSIIAIANGHVTGRKVGDSLRDLVVTVLRSPHFNQEYLANYTTRMPDGRILKSTTVLLRDAQRVPVGVLCINLDVTDLRRARQVLDQLSATQEAGADAADSSPSDMPDHIWQVVERVVEGAIADAGVPVPEMSREAKLRIVQFLDDKGIFLIRRSVEYVAEQLQISRQTLYAYIEQVRQQSRPRGTPHLR